MFPSPLDFFFFSCFNEFLPDGLEGAERQKELTMRILVVLVILLQGCAIPCDWISEEVCEPLPGEELTSDADVIGDSDVSVHEIPWELQRCVEGVVPTWTAICEHFGGERTQVCAVSPNGATVCKWENPPLIFTVKQCVPGEGAPRTVYTCVGGCEQDLTVAFEERTPAALREALSKAPVCSNPQAFHIPDAQSCSGVPKPFLLSNYCARTMPQACSGRWKQISVCYGQTWVPSCVCTP